MRNVVVTGAAAGIGKAVAAAARQRGDRVVAVDLDNCDVAADLSTPVGRRSAVDQISQGLKRIDGLIACAGLSPGRQPVDPGKIVSVNYFGVTELATGLLPLLANSEAPRVVAMSSSALATACSAAVIDACLAGDEAAAVAACREVGAELTYSSSKRALSRWVKRLAVTTQWAGAGILLNAVAPGVTVTAMTQWLLETTDGVALLSAAAPMRIGRPAQPAEIASCALFLAGADNSFVVGQTLFCDGGAEATLRPEHI